MLNVVASDAFLKSETNVHHQSSAMVKKAIVMAVAIGFLLPAAALGEVAKAPKTQIISTKVICKEPGRYLGWPTIARTQKGELLIVFSGERDAHVCPWGKTEMVRSCDGGKTWTKPITINNTPLDDRDAGIIETKKGTLLVSWFTSLAFERNPRWARHAQKITPEVREQWLGYWTRRSVDGGKSWDGPIRTRGSAPHGPIELSDGRLLYVGRRSPHADTELTVEQSTDDGRSWQQIASIKVGGGDNINYFHEPHVAELKNGRLVAMFRYEPPDMSQCFLRQSESDDGGRTWSATHKTPIWGYPPYLIQLKNGWLLVVYGRRIPPYGERACISKDGGKTWDIENEIVLSNAPNNDLGYPSSVQLDDGSIWTVYYQVDKPGQKPCLMGTHWRLYEDKDSLEQRVRDKQEKAAEKQPRYIGGFIQNIGEILIYGSGRCKGTLDGSCGWVSCFQGADGTIYLHGNKKSTDSGKTVVPHTDPSFDQITRQPEGSIYCRDGLFFAVDGPTYFVRPGVYRAKAWRSTDNLKTIKEEGVVVNVPQGPKRPRRIGEWFGLYFFRPILEMPDGTWLAGMTANFHSDRLAASDRQSANETKYKNRSIVVCSNDEGKTWNYLSTVAYPKPGDPTGEGFDEPAMVRLDDGRLLCIMRTGHFSPLYACWSSDDGKTWTKPMYTGFDRGCAPFLLKLSDGRVLLSYGMRWPAGSYIDQSRPGWKQRSLLKFAISEDGNENWDQWQVAVMPTGMGSSYSTVIEVEPNVIFCQVDGRLWRVTLRPR